MSGYLSSRARVCRRYEINSEEFQVWESPGFGDDELYPVYKGDKWTGLEYRGIPSKEQVEEALKSPKR